MDEQTSILHLRLAVVGGMVITGAGLVSLLAYEHFPVLSFTVGPLISLVAWRGLREFQRRKSFVVIRVAARRQGRRKY
jgi:hypothetical protein